MPLPPKQSAGVFVWDGGIGLWDLKLDAEWRQQLTQNYKAPNREHEQLQDIPHDLVALVLVDRQK